MLHQDSLKNQKNVLLPIHPPLIINFKDEEDEEDDEEEENYVSNWMPKTAADIEEERAIKEVCCKSGEYYRIQYADKHQSTNYISSPPEKELLPLDATQRNLQKGGDGSVAQEKIFVEGERREAQPREKEGVASKNPNVKGSTIPTKINNTKREGKHSRGRAPPESIPRTDGRSFENGGIHASDPKGKAHHQLKGQSKGVEPASSMPFVRATGRNRYFPSSAPQRSSYTVYRTVTQEPKFSGSPAVPEPRGRNCSKPKNQPDGNRRFWTQTENYGYCNASTWRTRNPDAKPWSKSKTTTQQSQEDTEGSRKGKRYIAK